MTFSDQRLVRRINEYCNGEISETGFTELQRELRSSRSARDVYRRYLGVHAQLYDSVEQYDQPAVAARAPRLPGKPPAFNIRRSAAILIGFAAVCLVLGVLWVVLAPNRPAGWDESQWLADHKGLFGPDVPERYPAVVMQRPIAIVSMAVGAASGSGKDLLGQALNVGHVTIDSGIIQIDFLSGVSVVLEGPADLELQSEERGLLHSGKARLYVSKQGQGFVLETPSAKLVDMGTEFAVQVAPDGGAELHVFDGKVDVYPSELGDAPLSMPAGKALRLAPGAAPAEIPLQPESFVTASEIGQLAGTQGSNRYLEWIAQRQELTDAPGLLVFYDFEPDPSLPQRLVNRCSEDLHGVIVGCSWADGRWPGKKSLEFKRPHDRVLLDIPGRFESLTFSAWLRLDGFDRFYNSILLPDEFRDGHVHWQVRSSGKIDMGVQPRREKRLLYLSDPQLSFADLGRWVHLTSVFNRPRGEVVHYLDGQPVSRVPIPTGVDYGDRPPVEQPFLLQIGKAELGNWSPADRTHPQLVRNLNGRIDELLIFDRPLTAGEVKRLYEIGKP